MQTNTHTHEKLLKTFKNAFLQDIKSPHKNLDFYTVTKNEREGNGGNIFIYSSSEKNGAPNN